MSLAPLATDLPAEALRILAQATPFHTPCGDGEIAWHAWGEGEPLVLLHGGSGSWTHWIRNVEALSGAGRRVFVPDLPGMGDSARPPGGHDADAVVDPLAAGLRQLLGEGPHDLTGFSFGGLTAGLLAARHPGLVRRLVLVGAPGLGLRDQRLVLRSWREQADDAGRLEAHRSNLQTLMVWRPEAADALAVALQAANVPRDRMRGRNLAMTDILARTLPTLRCRVDAIYGERDALYSDCMPQLVAVLRGMPCMREVVVVPDAGHWVQYEAAEGFNGELVRLLA